MAKLTITISPEELHAAVRKYVQDEFPGGQVGSVYVKTHMDDNLASFHEDHWILYPQDSSCRFQTGKNNA